ncbi:hypothetical protein FB451DRAFT_1369192 [Mycena latifolia]|nr:hypothetical protein FB451DRAFT_1369192 [Mycena latifolia]
MQPRLGFRGYKCGFQPSGFVTGRRAVTTGRDPSVQYFSVRFRRPGTGRVDPSTGHPLPVRRRVDGSSKDKVNQRRTFSVSIWATRDDGVLWRIGKAAITAGFPLMNFNSFALLSMYPSKTAVTRRRMGPVRRSTLEMSLTDGWARPVLSDGRFLRRPSRPTDGCKP